MLSKEEFSRESLILKLGSKMKNSTRRTFFIETYGCQMNLNDSEIVSSVLNENGFEAVETEQKADVILINTCSVRENAENRVLKRLNELARFRNSSRKTIVGVLGCMAEKFKEKLFELNENIDFLVGPDEYRNIAEVISDTDAQGKAIAVELKEVETYENIVPSRFGNISAWVSIMRGCNNFCSYCIVPYTRGRERSRKADSIIRELKSLKDANFKEITLLGQNVNSYFDKESERNFASLLSECSDVAPSIRFRFVTSHPKDLSDELLEVMANHSNICKHIHLAMQSGSDSILKKMNRKYTIGHYISRVEAIRKYMPDCAISTDIIAGFPSETIDDHKATLEAMNIIRFDGAFMFRYSPREGTKSFDMKDDVPEEEKIRRLTEIIDLQSKISASINQATHGKIFEVLVENTSKRNKSDLTGRTSTNKKVVFPSMDRVKIGEFVNVKILRSSSATLIGEPIF